MNEDVCITILSGICATNTCTLPGQWVGFRDGLCFVCAHQVQHIRKRAPGATGVASWRLAACSFQPTSMVMLGGGWAHLHLAAYSDRREIAKTLLTVGAKVYIKSIRRGTPLAIAHQYGNTELAEILLKHGAEE